jgi:cyclopropane fatty-acyl-phospholipid synthase-like methyltransferase
MAFSLRLVRAEEIGMSKTVDRYNTTYSRFATALSIEIRREVFGEDIGQNSWTTAEEQVGFARKAGLGPNSHLLEVGCGSGGPAIFLARTLGLTVTGVDINEAGIAAANAAAMSAGLTERAKFICLDGGGTFPFADQSFDAVQSIDAFNHIPDRRALLTELHRLLRPGGTMLYTDPVVITGPVSSEEIAARSSIGFFIFMPPGENETILQECGFDLVSAEDVTANMELIAGRWLKARENRRTELIEAEGVETYEGSVKFSRAVIALSKSRRLSRFAFLARRPLAS